MFVFGTPEERAAVYWDTARRLGPGVAEAPFDEMTDVELRVAQVCSSVALRNAEEDEAGDDVIEVLRQQVFTIARYQIEFDDYVRGLAAEGRFNPRGVKTSVLTELARSLNRNA